MMMLQAGQNLFIADDGGEEEGLTCAGEWPQLIPSIFANGIRYVQYFHLPP